MKTSRIFQNVLLIFFLLQVSCSSLNLEHKTSQTLLPSEITSITESPPGEKPLVKLPVCNSFVSATSAPIWYANDNGLFKKYGLDIELTDFESGSKAVTAMIAGEFPICQVAGTPVSNAVLAGEDLVYIAEYYDDFLLTLMATKDIQKPEDLKGKVVAITQAGSAHDTAMRLALKNMGLEPDKDVALISAGGDLERLAALESGQIAGALFSPPTSYIVGKKGYQVLLDLSDLEMHYARQGIATNKEFLDTNHETVLNFVKAIVEAITLMKNDPEGTKQVFARHLDLDLKEDNEILDEAYKIIVIKYLRSEPYPTSEGIETVLSEISFQNPDALQIQPEDIIDESILKELDDIGFMKGLNLIP